ncbi:MAG: hypothetical protein EHM21_03715, partial [Chloroflexi bacterium]
MIARHLLSTKLQTPPLRTNRVISARLLQKLTEGFSSGSRLSLICAPAGYGKTTLAIEWLQQGKTFCWLTLDDTDNDLHRFFTGLVAALQTIDPAIGASTLNLLRIPQPPPVEIITGELINEVNAVAQPFVLALDDYQHIHTSAIHEALEAMLSYPPANLHLLITSREDPVFPLARLRVRGQVTEVRARDLRFTGEEIQPFLSQVHHLNLPPALLEKLLELTEGWAAGLQLTGLAFQNEEDAESFFAAFSGTHQYIIEYLMEEVLRRQPEEVRHFLTRTSILERFNAELCEEVIRNSGFRDPEEQNNPLPRIPNNELPIQSSTNTLDYLYRSNLFLTPLDGRREWYRYHRLFADVLRSGLDPGEEAGLHLRAAGWFERHELYAEAIPHYLAAGDTRAAARLVHSQSAGLVEQGELQTLLRWLQALPEAEVQGDPQLLAVQALALLLTGEIPRAMALLESAGPPGAEREGAGALLAVKAWMGLVCGGQAGLQDLAQQALATLRPHETIFRVLALLALGTGYNSRQNIGASTEAFQEAYSLGLKMQHPFAAAAGLANLAFNLYDMGQLRKARALCQDALARFTGPRGKPLPVQGMVLIPLAAICLEQNDRAAARQFAQEGRDLCQKLFSSGMMGGDAEVVLAMVAFLEGERDRAFAIAAETRQFAVEHRVAFLDDKMTVLEAILHLRSGDIQAVQDCLARLGIQDREPVPGLPLTMRVLNAQVQAFTGHLEEALAGLVEVEPSLRQNGQVRGLITLLAIEAEVLTRLGRLAEARDRLAEAVRLAAPEGYRQALLHAGPALAGLFPQVREIDPAFVDGVVAALPPVPA